MITTEALHAAYYASVEADRAWSDELSRVYGMRAREHRYGISGYATPKLKELHDAKLVADERRREAADQHSAQK